MFLTDDDLQFLTGAARASGQVEWLRARGWRYELDRDGRPRVARAYMERRMVGETPAPDAAGHNWGALGVG